MKKKSMSNAMYKVQTLRPEEQVIEEVTGKQTDRHGDPTLAATSHSLKVLFFK